MLAGLQVLGDVRTGRPRVPLYRSVYSAATIVLARGDRLPGPDELDSVLYTIRGGGPPPSDDDDDYVDDD